MKKRVFAIILVALITFTTIIITGCSDDNGNREVETNENVSENEIVNNFTDEQEENLETTEFEEKISSILGVEYVILEEEQSFEMPDGRTITWRFINLLGNELLLDGFVHNDNGNVLGSKTGDVIYTIVDGSKFLYIDLGSAQSLGWSEQHRMYSVFTLN